MAEDGGEVWLGGEGGCLLDEQLQLLPSAAILAPSPSSSAGPAPTTASPSSSSSSLGRGEVHRGEERAEQVLVGLGTVDHHQLSECVCVCVGVSMLVCMHV